MNILIVHAHHEPKSFCSALKDQAIATLTSKGHTVEVSDLYAMGFDPVSDRRNFTTVKDPEVLKQQQEELHALANDGFASDIAAEMEKVQRCDLMIFVFPLWWFGLPAILKGWVDRVFAMGKMYGGSMFFENGAGKGKRALLTITIGGSKTMYDGYGLNTPLETMLEPIHRGIFWFTGFMPLEPFLVHGPARISEEERKEALLSYARYLENLENVPQIVYPSTDQFQQRMGTDCYSRWMVEVRQTKQADEQYRQQIPAERIRIEELKREGKIVFSSFAKLDDPDWVGWLMIREQSRERVNALLETLPLHPYLDFKIHEALRPQPASN
jgi:NAD(P)H dehydrogenase (quinone)